MAASPHWSRLRRFSRAAPVLVVVLLATAAVLTFWVTPWLAQASAVPDGMESVTTTSVGSVSTLVDLEADGLVDAQPVLVTRTRTTTVDELASHEAAGSGLNAAVTSTSDVTAAEDGRIITHTRYRLAADQHSQALMDCCGSHVDGAPTPVAGSGSPLRFPWFTPSEPYPYYDVTARATAVLAPIGSEEVGGIRAMKFQQSETPVLLGSVAVPGQLVDSDEESVNLQRAYAVNRTVWVDPTTGVVLRDVERIRQTLRDSSGSDVITLLVMTTATAQDDVRRQVALATAQGRAVRWAHSYGPAFCIAAGVLLLLGSAIGLVVTGRADRVAREFPDEFASFEDLRPILD